MASYGLRKSTKHVWLLFYMKSDYVISGEFHVPVSTSSTIRPSDALPCAKRAISSAWSMPTCVTRMVMSKRPILSRSHATPSPGWSSRR